MQLIDITKITTQDLSLFTIQAKILTLDHINNDILFNEITNKPKRVSNVSSNSTFEDTILETSVNTQAYILIKSIAEIANTLGYVVDTYWSHIHHKYESCDTHFHTNDNNTLLLSWVYYVRVPPNSGDLVFILDDKDSRVPLSIVTPKENTLILFPSFLRHKVTKNLSDEIRVSVAGNFIQKHING